MAERYLLGIDAGATKTAYALYDLRTGETLLLYGGCGNHEGMAGGYTELREVMETHLCRLCRAAGIQPADIDSAGLGIAGVDTRRQHGIISEIFRGIGLSRFALGNDAILGVKAECPAGICAVNGTGFSVYGVDDLGNTAQVGGLGDYTGDQGGGGFFAQRAVEAVYRALEKNGPETAMTGEMLALLGIADSALFVEAVSERLESERSDVFRKDLSVLLHRCAGAGDEAAAEILRASGREYAASVLGVLRRLPRLAENGSVELILVGSCFLRASCDLARRTLEQELKRQRPEVDFHIRPIQTDPAAGGLLWAREIAGIPEEEDGRIRASYGKATVIS